VGFFDELLQPLHVRRAARPARIVGPAVDVFLRPAVVNRAEVRHSVESISRTFSGISSSAMSLSARNWPAASKTFPSSIRCRYTSSTKNGYPWPSSKIRLPESPERLGAGLARVTSARWPHFRSVPFGGPFDLQIAEIAERAAIVEEKLHFPVHVRLRANFLANRPSFRDLPRDRRVAFKVHGNFACIGSICISNPPRSRCWDLDQSVIAFYVRNAQDLSCSHKT
jgi:hypothetical protein